MNARDHDTQVMGTIFDIQRYSIHDGPGIRTTVFLKGCPLRCSWCANPESWHSHPELSFINGNCTGCGRCMVVCPKHAIVLKDNKSVTDRQLCDNCGDCVVVCPNKARDLIARNISVAEVVAQIEKDEVFYRTSGGGVTLSGGEPTMQPEFCRALLKTVYEMGYETVLDTCGLVRWEILESIVKYVDLVHFDLKHMDDEAHLRYTGVSNGIILSNAKKLSLMGKPLIARVPLIPGVNDSLDNLRKTAKFCKQLPSLRRLDLLPYHRLGMNKFERLGRNYTLSELKAPDKNHIEDLANGIRALGLGIEIQVGG